MMRQHYRLESVALHEVGVFDDVRLDFPPITRDENDERKAEIHLFTGPNGCGKSTLLYALAEIFDGFVTSDIPRSSSPIPIRGRFRGRESYVDFLFTGLAGAYGVRVRCMSSPCGNRFGAYQIHEDDPVRGVFFGFGDGEHPEEMQRLHAYKSQARHFTPAEDHSLFHCAFAAFAYSGQRNLRDMALAAIQPMRQSPFDAALAFDGSVRPDVLIQWLANNRTQFALAKADGDTRAAASYDLTLARITGLVKDVCDLDLEFRLERAPLAVTLRLNGETIRFDGLPDGLKSIISWVGDLSLRLEAIPWEEERDLFSQPIILFLDEVDIHLHPKWQRRILPAIQKLLPNAQVFVSTHSPFVVGSVEDAWVYRLPEPGQGGVTGTIEAIPSGAGKSYRLILEEVFGVEGEFDVETEALFASFYQERDRFLKERGEPDALLVAARPLAARGDEAAAIVGRELRQVARVTGREVGLA